MIVLLKHAWTSCLCGEGGGVMIVFWGHDAVLSEDKTGPSNKHAGTGLVNLTKKLEENWIHQNKREMEQEKKELIEM